MSQVEAAIQAGRCSLAISGALMRDPVVMLALKERAGLSPMALSGPVTAPVVPVSAGGVARSVSGPNGLLIVVEPERLDQAGLDKLAELVGAAGNKPRVLVVARNYDALRFSMAFRGCKIEQVKERGTNFLVGMPTVAEAEPAAATSDAKAAKKAAEPAGPRFTFVGRDDELAALSATLGSGGPVVVSGPSGVGKTQVLEHAIEAAGLARLPDLAIGRGAGFDTLIARLAAITRDGGSDLLVQALAAPHKPADLVAAAVQALQAAAGTDGKVMVVEGLHLIAGRQGDFFRKSRLELLCEALLTHSYPLRLVFTSLVQPVFYREGRDAPLRRHAIGGIKGRFYHEIFEAMGAADVPRDTFGPMSEKLHGHCLAVRTAAVAVKHNPALVNDDKFFRMASIDDVEVVDKQLARRIERLSDAHKDLLANLAHLRYPVDGGVLSELGVSRKDRTHLIAEGLLDMVGTEAGRKYQVHRLVVRTLPARETARFGTLGELGAFFAKRAAKEEGVEKLALQQEANRCFVAARMHRDVIATEHADADPAVESCYGLVRSQKPNFDMAVGRLREVLGKDPSNADAHLLLLEALRRQDAKGDVIQDALQAALDAAPVPEVFHEAVAFHLARNARNKAIKVLEDAVAAFPDQSRLRTRLAALLTRAGRRPEAIEHLRQAMDLDPMLPDAYGLLGVARREEGAEKLEEAETLMREAVRLAPGDIVQTSRLVWLLLDVAKGVPERAEAVRKEVRELLDAVLQVDKKSWEAQLMYAVALREEGDADRAAWFLKQAQKNAPRGRGGVASRFELEEALIEIASGKAEAAEQRLRRVVRKEPTNARAFAALSKALEARGQLVAAFTELHRAAERTAPGSLDRQAFDLDLDRLRALVEATAGAVPEVPSDEPVAEGEAPSEEDGPAVTADELAEAGGDDAPHEDAPAGDED